MQAWFDSYAVIGAAAATLTGLLFSATEKAWELLNRIAAARRPEKEGGGT